MQPIERQTTTTAEGKPEESRRPQNVIVVLLDSLNRHLLGCYGGREFDTPNLDRFARRSTRFDNHVAGSLPCMPARHDILCGAMDFLWKPWGSVELWEHPITWNLRQKRVTTMLVSDHPHLFETGGENYHTDFFGWEYLRGHENDPWKSYMDPTWVGAPARPARPSGSYLQKMFGLALGDGHGYDRSRTFFRSEMDFPGPRVMSAAARWLREATPHHESWMLFVDEFDPHEPFDTPEPWLRRYEETPWNDDVIIWPPYVNGAITDGWLTESEARHIRANYGSKLSMIDHWFGEILTALDEQDLWDTTAVIVCTDHGHYLGDVRAGKDIWGKPPVPQYEPMAHLPLLIHWPGVAGGGTCEALTTAVDLHATIADVFDVQVEHRTHGSSLAPLLRGEVQSVRAWAVGGYYGGWVQINDGRRKYARAAVGDNFPLSMWSNRWSTMPVDLPGIVTLPAPDGRAWLDHMPGSEIPVIRQPFEPGSQLPFWATRASVDEHHLYDLAIDPDEGENRVGDGIETEMIEMLHEALTDLEAPNDQFERLGLA
jgi:arylsulfatase A-like enzyme